MWCQKAEQGKSKEGQGVQDEGIICARRAEVSGPRGLAAEVPEELQEELAVAGTRYKLVADLAFCVKKDDAGFYARQGWTGGGEVWGWSSRVTPVGAGSDRYRLQTGMQAGSRRGRSRGSQKELQRRRQYMHVWHMMGRRWVSRDSS